MTVRRMHRSPTERLCAWGRSLLPQRQFDRDSVRVVCQMILATTVTYAVIRALGLPNLSWAVVVALLTVHRDADATLTSGLGHIAGAAIGSVLGLTVVAALGGPDLVLVRLSLTIAVTGAIIVVWPALQYLAMTAAVVALYPDPELAGAYELAMAVIIGTLAGVAAALLVMPKSSGRSVHYLVEQCLSDCRDLLDRILKGTDKASVRERDQAHADFLDHLQDARKILARTYRPPTLPGGASLRDALTAIERLWAAVLILDRVVRDELPYAPADRLQRLRPSIDHVRQAACELVDELMERANGTSRSPSLASLHQRIEATKALGRQHLAGQPAEADADHGRALHALFFALDAVSGNIEELDRLMTRGSDAGKD